MDQYPLAIFPVALRELERIESRELDLMCADLPAVESRRGDRGGVRTPEGVALLPFHGPVQHRASISSDWGVSTSTESFGAAFDEVATREGIKGILIDVHSPGGSVYGLRELSTKIREARRSDRPIVAIANDFAFSAAYYVASAADRVVVTPGGMAGSIGTMWVHTEYSKAFDAAGITNTTIYKGKHKTDGIDTEPLTDQARKEYQALVDRYYDQFVEDVALNRGVDVATVERNFGQGRIFIDEDAVRVGLADAVGTMDSVLAELLGASDATAADRPVEQRTQASRDLDRRRLELKSVEAEFGI